jgi:hypothetical protein
LAHNGDEETTFLRQIVSCRHQSPAGESASALGVWRAVIELVMVIKS